MAQRRPWGGNFIAGLLGTLLLKVEGDLREVSAREQLQAGENIVREVMRQLRLRLRREVRAFGGSPTDRAGRARHVHGQARKFLKVYRRALKRDARFELDVNLMDEKYRKSPILDTLLPNRRTQWLPLLQRSRTARPVVLDLLNFSFIDEPASTLRQLKNLGEIEGYARNARLNFKDKFCEDAGAYLVLAEIWPQMAMVFQGGEMQSPVQRVLDATGVSKHNRMRTPATESVRLASERPHSDIWAYPLQRRRPANSSQSATQHLDLQAREKAADRFSEWIDTCLSESADLELTIQGKANIALIMGEVLCNAERHSTPGSDDGEWAITAFMIRQNTAAGEVYRCMIAFLSVGQSIADSLETAAPVIRDSLAKYLAAHRHCGRTPATLSTVFALQDTITCDPMAREGGSGGTGLQDMLDFVNVLGASLDTNATSKVTIVSGKSCIMMRAPYIRGIRDRNESTKPRLLWFNPENVAAEPPDSNFVFDLVEQLSGTLVSIAFTLDAAFLLRQVEKENGGDRP